MKQDFEHDYFRVISSHEKNLKIIINRARKPKLYEQKWIITIIDSQIFTPRFYLSSIQVFFR